MSRRIRETGQEPAFQRLQSAVIVEQPARQGILPPKQRNLAQSRPFEWEVRTNGVRYRLLEFRDVVQIENAEGNLSSGDITHYTTLNFAKLMEDIVHFIENPYRLDFERKLDEEGFFLVDKPSLDRRLFITQNQYVVLPRKTRKIAPWSCTTAAVS